MIRQIAAFFVRLLEIIDFPGYTYLNLWSLSLLIVSIWVCIETRSVPGSVAAIFASIVTAYAASSVGVKYMSKNIPDLTKEKKDDSVNAKDSGK